MLYSTEANLGSSFFNVWRTTTQINNLHKSLLQNETNRKKKWEKQKEISHHLLLDVNLRPFSLYHQFRRIFFLYYFIINYGRTVDDILSSIKSLSVNFSIVLFFIFYFVCCVTCFFTQSPPLAVIKCNFKHLQLKRCPIWIFGLGWTSDIGHNCILYVAMRLHDVRCTDIRCTCIHKIVQSFCDIVNYKNGQTITAFYHHWTIFNKRNRFLFS